LFFNVIHSDVIGEVVGRDVPKTKEVSGRMAKLIDIEIEDLEYGCFVS
jgi:hypothetical protein